MEEPEDLLRNAEQCAFDLIETIMQNGGDLLYDNYISEKSIPFAVRSTLCVLGSTVEQYYMRHSATEGASWPEETEPSPCSIDTWARNAIPVKRKMRMPSTEQTSFALPADAKSVASHSSRRSALGRSVRQGRSLRNPKENASIEEIVAPVPIPQDKNNVSEEEEMIRTRKEREVKRKKEESDRMKKIRDEEVEKEKKMQKETEDIKNKSFTYDHRGKILYVNSVKYDSIPAMYTAVKYVSEEPLQELPKPLVRKTQTRDFASVKRNKTAPHQEKEWVKNITSIQPPLIEAIKLSANVTFIEGPRVKYAQNLEDSKTMSRKQYNALYQPKIDQTALNTGMPDKKSSMGSSVDSLKRSPDSKGDLFDIIPDFEDFNAAAETNQKGSPVNSPSRTAQQHGKIIHYGSGFKADELAGSSQKFNAEILKNKNWGLNPPIREPRLVERVPKRPDSKELRELYGDIVKKPKDKPFITPQELWESRGPMVKKPRDRPNIERVEKKTRMPPPPYGFTMINALPEIPGLAGSMASAKSMNKSEIMK